MADEKILKKFKERYGSIVGDQKEFFSCIEAHLPKAFRVNTLKADKKSVVEKFKEYGIEINQVNWYKDAFITDFFAIGNTIEHFMGHIYIQELTSMIPPLIISDLLKGNSLVIDAAAAPGSKTTQIAAFMGNKGTIIANDVNYSRIKSLKFNIEKLGVLNTIITNQDFRFFSFPGKAEILLLDAPCTSEGTIRKGPAILSNWSEAQIFGMSRLQKQMILKGFDLVKESGYLIYSTCTFAPEENEEVVQYLVDNRKGVEIEKIKIDGLKLTPGILEWEKKKFSDEISKTIRIWPHHNDTGGFFVAKIRKTGGE